jgi:carboxyl-terminal processing protease
MFMQVKRFIPGVAISLVLLLSACAATGPKRTEDLSSIDEIQKIVGDAAEPTQDLTPLQVSQALVPPLSIADAGMTEEPIERFHVSVNNVPAQEFFMGLVKGTDMNMVVHPDVDGLISLDLRNVTVDEVMAIVRNMYGYSFKHVGNIYQVYPAGLQTEVFRINYLNVQRRGSSEIQVSAGQVSDAGTQSGSSDGGSEGSAQKNVFGTKIRTDSDADFWGELQQTLSLLVGKEGGQSVIITPQTGIVVVRAMPDELEAVRDYLTRAQLILRRQVIIEAKVLEVELNDGFQSGINWSALGEFGGLGLEVGMEDGFVKVISPIDDTPAQKAGIESGDLVVKLDNQPVKGMSLSEAVSIMRGKRGSKITLTVVREGINQPFEVTITRDIIKVTSVKQRLLAPGYGYLRIATFQTNTGNDVAKGIQELGKESPLKGLIIDLRNNPGGVLQAAVEVADAFLDESLVVYTEGRLAQSKTRFNAKDGDLSNGIPLVVLINGGSASASEIVAGALQDHRRAILLGTRSFGKGSVQTVLPITKDKAIKLTTALYFTPNGRSIQAQGITPDIEVARATITRVDTPSNISEADLARHLDNGNGKADNIEDRNSDNPLEQDNQLYEAFNLIKGLTLLQASNVKAGND